MNIQVFLNFLCLIFLTASAYAQNSFLVSRLNQYARNSWCASVNLTSNTTDLSTCEDHALRRSIWRERRNAYNLFESTAFNVAAERQISSERCLADQYRYLVNQRPDALTATSNRLRIFTANNVMTWLYLRKIDLLLQECTLAQENPARFRRARQDLRQICTASGQQQLIIAKAQMRLSVTAADDRIFTVIKENRSQIKNTTTNQMVTDQDILNMDFNAIQKTRIVGLRIERSQRLYDQMKTTLEELAQEKAQIAAQLEQESRNGELSSDAKQYLYASGAVIRTVEDPAFAAAPSGTSQQQVSEAKSCLRSRYEANLVGEVGEFFAVSAVGGAALRLGLRGLSAVSRSVGLSRASSVFGRMSVSRFASGALGYGAYLTIDGLHRECISALGTGTSGRSMKVENMVQALSDLPEDVDIQPEATLQFLGEVSDVCKRVQGKSLVNSPRAGSCVQELVMNALPGIVATPFIAAEIPRSFQSDQNN